jgi:hypothetical protein
MFPFCSCDSVKLWHRLMRANGVTMTRTTFQNLFPAGPNSEAELDRMPDGQEDGEFNVALDFASKAGVKA